MVVGHDGGEDSAGVCFLDCQGEIGMWNSLGVLVGARSG